MNEQRKKEIEALAKEMFMKDIGDLIDEHHSLKAVSEYATGCFVVAKSFYDAFDKAVNE